VNVRPILLGVLIATVLAACGGGSKAGTVPTTSFGSPAPPGSLAALLGLKGGSRTIQSPDVLAAGARDFAAGSEMRVPLGLFSKDGKLEKADASSIQVYLAPDALSPAIGPFTATLESLESPDVATADNPLKWFYVLHVTAPKPGNYFIAAKYTVGGKPSFASGGIVFAGKQATPAIGSPAPRSDNPTLASTNGNLKALTTASPPDTTLLKYSIADSIAHHIPVVAVFATPAFCTSRVCGPSVKVIQAAQKQMAGKPIRFIHIEIYQDNDPSKPANQWVQQWNLPSEPWTFVIGRKGTLLAKFEGAVSVPEVVQAAQAALKS
jgi:hypothetical protein